MNSEKKKEIQEREQKYMKAHILDGDSKIISKSHKVKINIIK